MSEEKEDAPDDYTEEVTRAFTAAHFFALKKFEDEGGEGLWPDVTAWMIEILSYWGYAVVKLPLSPAVEPKTQEWLSTLPYSPP